jgi:hypothetical protein
MQSETKYSEKYDDDPVAGVRRRRPGRGPASIFEAAAAGLAMPVCGMEAEFNVVMDGVEIDPRVYWGDPTAFIDAPMLTREKSSHQMPTGGAVYFDRGVIEVVTPVIELAPGCTARVVRNLWEQIAFVRDELTKWETKSGKHIRLKAYSAHYNVSFELKRREQDKHRNIQKIALLLAHLLPIPLALVGTNRRSTGLGVRPRGNRIEITADFTPDPGLMIATATLVVGIVRAVIEWPSYELSMLEEHGIPLIAGVIPGKHTTRKGWLTKDFQYPGQSPFTTDVDSRVWKMRDGTLMSLRAIARQITWYFRQSIRRYADPFSMRHLFSIMSGRAPSMLELPDRPPAYYDVGRLIRWGMVLPPLASVARGRTPNMAVSWEGNEPFEAFLDARDKERAAYWGPLGGGTPALSRPRRPVARTASQDETEVKRSVSEQQAAASARPAAARLHAGGNGRTRVSETAPRPRRSLDNPLSPPRGGGLAAAQRRARALERRKRERRSKRVPVPFPDRRLTRSAYEQVFLKLVSGGRLRIGPETYTPVGMRGWDQAVFRRDSDGKERLLSIDQLLKKINDWKA